MPNGKGGDVYPLHAFDPQTIEPSSTIMIIGGRDSGKSVLQNDLMYWFAKCNTFSYGVAMSPTRDTLNSWKGRLPRSCIYEKYNAGVVETLLKTQDRDEHDNRMVKNVFLFLDDCMFEKGVLSTACMRELFMNGRHKRILFMNTVQYMMDMPAQIRGCVDYVFLMSEPIYSNRKRLYEYFFGVFPKLQDFNTAMDLYTMDKRCLVFCRKSRAMPGQPDLPQHRVFWYRASPSLPFYRLCRPVFWYLDDFYTKRNEKERVGKARALIRAR